MTEFIYDYKLDTERSECFNEGYWNDEDKQIALVFKNGSIAVRDLSNWGSSITPGAVVSTSDMQEFDRQQRSWGHKWHAIKNSSDIVDITPNTFIAREVAEQGSEGATAFDPQGYDEPSSTDYYRQDDSEPVSVEDVDSVDSETATSLTADPESGTEDSERDEWASITFSAYNLDHEQARKVETILSETIKFIENEVGEGTYLLCMNKGVGHA